MTKVMLFTLFLFVALSVNVFGDEGEPFFYAYGFFSHFNGTRTNPTDEVLEIFIRQFFPDEYNRNRRNDFEWPRLRTRVQEEIRQGGIDVNSGNTLFKIGLNIDLLDYNFSEEGFQIPQISNSLVVGSGSNLLNVALFIENLDKYNFFKIEPDRASAFLESRNNRFNWASHRLPFTKKVHLIVYFKINAYSSSFYTENARTYGRNYYVVPAIIERIEVWDEFDNGDAYSPNIIEYLGELSIIE